MLYKVSSQKIIFFVDRKEALVIAEYFNQIKFKHEPKDELLSEDLI